MPRRARQPRRPSTTIQIPKAPLCRRSIQHIGFHLHMTWLSGHWTGILSAIFSCPAPTTVSRDSGRVRGLVTPGISRTSTTLARLRQRPTALSLDPRIAGKDKRRKRKKPRMRWTVSRIRRCPSNQHPPSPAYLACLYRELALGFLMAFLELEVQTSLSPYLPPVSTAAFHLRLSQHSTRATHQTWPRSQK